VIAALAARFRDLDLAEEAFAESCARAARHWRLGGVPDDPAAWLYRTAQRAALDAIRKRQVRGRHAPDAAHQPLDVDQHAERRDQHDHGRQHATDEALPQVGDRGVVEAGRQLVEEAAGLVGGVGLFEAGPEDGDVVELADGLGHFCAERARLADGRRGDEEDDGGEGQRQAAADQGGSGAPPDPETPFDHGHQRGQRQAEHQADG